MATTHRLPLGVRRALMRAVRSLLCAGFAWDWLVAAALITINFTVPGSNLVPAADRLWFPDDPALRFPAVESWLNEQQKFPVELGLPLLAAALAQLFWRSGGGDGALQPLAAPGNDFHAFALSLTESFAIETSFKRWMALVGKLRPDWLARVKKGDPEALREGRTSYPSGHAAETTMAFGLLTLYLLGRLRLLSASSPPRPGHFLRVVLCLAPVGFAVFITLSRVAAYKHDFADVNAGMAIGLLSGLLAYLCNFYSLRSSFCVFRVVLCAL